MAGIVESLRKVRKFFLGMGGGLEADDDRGSVSVEGLANAGLTSGSKAYPVNAEPGVPPFRLHHNPRRYKRALLTADAEPDNVLSQIVSASALYRGRPFAVADLSHTGVAIERGGILDGELPESSKPEPIVLNLGVLEPFSAQVTAVRHSERVIAFEFVDVPTDGRLTIDRFLDPKMIGLNMRAVDRSFFSPGETFSLWFCGPRDTNFFLWMNGRRLDRAIIQLGDEQFTLAPSAGASRAVRFVRTDAPTLSGRAVSGSRSEADLRDKVLFALDVALQVKEGGDAMAGLVTLLTESVDNLPPGS